MGVLHAGNPGRHFGLDPTQMALLQDQAVWREGGLIAMSWYSGRGYVLEEIRRAPGVGSGVYPLGHGSCR